MTIVAQWLLCVWQAKAINASWWAVLLLLFTLWVIETNVMPPRRPSVQRGWPELLRAWITLISMYWACMLFLGNLWSGGRALGTILIVLTAWALIILPSSSFLKNASFLLFCDVLALFIGILSLCIVECIPSIQHHLIIMPRDWLGWIHLVCLLHLLLVSNRHESISLWRITGSTLVVLPLIIPSDNYTIACQPTTTLWMLLILPSIAMQMQQLIAEYIIPIIENICSPGLYVLLDSKKANALTAMLIQQRQEVLFYLICWALVLGWGCLSWTYLQLILVLLGLFSSLRMRYSKKSIVLPSTNPSVLLSNHINHNNTISMNKKQITQNNIFSSIVPPPPPSNNNKEHFSFHFFT